jgi:hypothetical protein
MTSVAFILGVVPLLTATGAGAEMRKALGTTVFGGMIGVTFFGIVLTPVFFVLIDRISSKSAIRQIPKYLGRKLFSIYHHIRSLVGWVVNFVGRISRQRWLGRVAKR